MKIDPRHLLQISVILDSGSFSAAAERLGTSQPALSRVVALVEKRLGTLLFDRESRPPKPTEAGLALGEQGRTIRAAARQATHVAERIIKGEFGCVRLGAPPFLCDHLIAPLIAEFLMHHPQTRIELRPEFFSSLQDRLLSDDIDLIIGPITLVDRSLPFRIERLTEDTNVLVCRAGHPLGRKRKIRAEDLERSSWISHSVSSTLHSDMQAALISAGVNKISLVFESSSAGAVLTMLEETDCLTMLPRNAAKPLAREGRLRILPFADRSPPRPIGIVTHAERTPATSAPTLIRFIRAKLQSGSRN